MKDTGEAACSAFGGTLRFELRRLLGAGGMGVVYAAYDRDCRCEVALKLLPNVGPAAAVRLKREFRLASGIQHTNLVSLGELIEDAGHLFFTMELVEGTDWRTYLHGSRRSSSPPSSVRASDATWTAPASDESRATNRESRSGGSDGPLRPADPVRLREALGQLTEGLACLHAHGKVHRDVKPSNVLVEGGGRLVLLDFGLAVDVSRQAAPERDGQRAAGTALYMSPEQARSSPVSPASDWYSVGVLLYAALCGRLPFGGTVADVLERKQREDPPPPTELASDVPEDLDRLCMALLARDPSERASAADILARLHAGSQPAPAVWSIGAGASHFVGRHLELAALQRSFETTSASPFVVVVQGESGVGKTALVRELCARLEARGGDEAPLIAHGVCSQRESVPYKGLDGVADGLAEHVATVLASDAPLVGARTRAAAGAAALAFPVLSRALGPRATASDPVDPWAKRDVAFEGMRDLLGSLARRRRVVLCIDDWQWVDADSVRLLAHVLAPPQAPPILLLLTSRPGVSMPPLPCAQERIELGNLTPDCAGQLATQLLAGVAPASRGPLAHAIASESLGHPLFIAALARRVLVGEELEGARPNLEDAIWSRVSALPALAREAAELLAVSRGPISLAVLQSALAGDALGTPWVEVTKGIVHLVRDNLARADGVRAADAVDCFHSRVAASIVARLSSAVRRARHGALARALERNDSADFESMSEHWAEAGATDKAAGYALRAADGAAAILAFETAARLYRRSLDLSRSQPNSTIVHERLAAALGHIGRGREAAEEYMMAAAGGERRLELHRLAADQLFRSGYIDDALRLIEHVFPSLGLRLPRTAKQAVLRLAASRARIRVRGLEFKPRGVDAVSSDALARVDAAWTVAVGLSTVDNLKGASVQSGHLLLALELGEPLRVVRAFAAEAAYRATVGVRSKAKVDTMLARADEFARKLGDPYALGFVYLARCFALYLRSEFTAARAAGEAAEAVFEQRPVMAAWELTSARMLLLCSHFYSGDLDVLRRRVPVLIREAESRGDLYSATCFRLGICNCAWLVDDDSDAARRNLLLAGESWHYEGVHLQHGWGLVSWVNIDLYEDVPADAYGRVKRDWGVLAGSFLMRFERLRAELYWLRARAALALARHDRSMRARLLSDAERCAKRLFAETAAWAPAVGHLVVAGVSALRGDASAVSKHLDMATMLAQNCDAHFVSRVRAQCTGEGQGFDGLVKRPEAWLRMLAPGLRSATR